MPGLLEGLPQAAFVWLTHISRPLFAHPALQLTQHIQTERPPSLRGGILADDMGLGKTLEVCGDVLRRGTLRRGAWLRGMRKGMRKSGKGQERVHEQRVSTLPLNPRFGPLHRSRSLLPHR